MKRVYIDPIKNSKALRIKTSIQISKALKNKKKNYVERLRDVSNIILEYRWQIYSEAECEGYSVGESIVVDND